MNNSKKDHHLESNSAVKPPAQKCQTGTLFHYFQKKVDPAKPPPKGECDEVMTNNLVSAAEGNQVMKNDTNGHPKQSKDSQHANCEASQDQTMQDQDPEHSKKYKQNPSENKLVDLTDKPDLNGASKAADHELTVKKVKSSCEIKSNMLHSPKRPSQNPFQIMMESGKKKGIWDKPATKAKEPEDISSEDDCLEVESVKKVSVGSTMQQANAKHFSIFSKKTNASAENTALGNGLTAKSPDAPSRCGIKEETSTKDGELKKLAKQTEPQSSSLGKSKSGKGLHRSSLDASKSSKKKKSSAGIAEDSTKEAKSKKAKDSLADKTDESSSAMSKTDRSKSGDDVMETDTASAPRKSRFKVGSDSDFEPNTVQSSGKRKGRPPSKSYKSDSKRPRTGSVTRGDADASSKPAALSAAQKLVKKSRHQKRRRSSDGARRDSSPSGKSGPKQTQLTAGQKDASAQLLAAAGQSDTESPRGRSARASSKQKRRRPPSDSELEFTPGRRTKGRQKETDDADTGHAPGRKSVRKRAHVRQTAEAIGGDATPVKKPTNRASAGGPRRHSSGTDVEVLATKRCDRRSADVVELSPEKRPERRSSRPRRPVILSDSEAEPSPVKRPARRSRAARPVTPTDSEPETTPAKKAPRRSSRAPRPVRRLSDSEVELSPLKKRTPRGGGRRSAAAAAEAADEPEVVLVRSRSAGARSGKDAFQMMRRGGRPPKQTAAEKAASEARRAFLSSGVPESLQVQAEVARRLEESLTPLFPEVSHVHQRGEEKEAAAAALPGAAPLPAGFSWRAESPPPPPPCPAIVSGLVPGLVPGKPAQSAGGDACSGELSSSPGDVAATPVEPAARSAAATDDTAAAPRLPCLSPAECAASLRHLLSAERDAASAAAAAAPVLWTERFRPRRHEAFVGGSLPAAELQQWLADWSAPSGRGWDDDGSEEPAGDATVLLVGPTGCGKTSAVYAAAAQLGFQVLEVSASIRRSGRHLSSQLSEATQSQRVSLSGGGGGTSAADPPSRSLLLLEDVQLTSDELDDGFLTAAASLAAAAKRPVVLTSGDPAVTRTRLLRALPHRLLTAVAPPADALRAQLALVALTRGWLLPDSAAARLAEGGDMRRALLQLQWLCEGDGAGGDAEKVDTRRALTEAQLETAEEFVDQLPAELKVVRLLGERPETAAETELRTEAVGRRQSGWQPPVREAAAGYDGQTRRRWRCVDPDLFSDEDDARPAPSPSPAPAAESTPGGSQTERPPPERALLAASVAALAGLCDLRSACDALVAPAERHVMPGWWQRRPQADMAETEQPRCVTEERGERLGRQLEGEILRSAGRRCAADLRTARSEFSASGRPEPAGLQLPLYDEEGVRAAAWEESSRLAPAVPSLLLSRRAAAADLLPSIRRICRVECGRRATDGGRTRRFLHYFDQMGLHAVPSGLRTHICKSLM